MDSNLNQLLTLTNYGERSAMYKDNLRTEIEKINTEKVNITSELDKTKDLLKLLDNVSERATKKVLYSVNPVCVLPVKLIHTGEYKIKLGEEMFKLSSLKETINYLNKNINSLEKKLEAFEIQTQELERRINFVDIDQYGEEEISELIDMPDEIVSEKGVAIKSKYGYEIVEVDPEPNIVVNKKRLSRVKK